MAKNIETMEKSERYADRGRLRAVHLNPTRVAAATVGACEPEAAERPVIHLQSARKPLRLNACRAQKHDPEGSALTSRRGGSLARIRVGGAASVIWRSVVLSQVEAADTGIATLLPS
jgi:hypothetical protein